MRIGLVIPDHLAVASGGYFYDRMLIRHLEAAGDTVYVLSIPSRGYWMHALAPASMRVHRFAQEANVDVLLEDELLHPALGWPRWPTRRFRGTASDGADTGRSDSDPLTDAYVSEQPPRISIVHHLRASEQTDEPKGTLDHARQWLEQQYLRSVDAFIFNSRATRNAVEQLSGERRPSTVAYPSGQDLGQAPSREEVAAHAHAPGPLRVLFVGNVIPRKRLHDLLEAVASSRYRVRLDVVGRRDADDAYARTVWQQAQEPALRRVVRWHGRVARPRLRRLMRDAHVLAVPSAYEGFGIVYLEAMSMGNAVIATSNGAPKELVSKDVGYLVAPGNLSSLQASLDELASDRDRLAAKAVAALDRYEAHPSWAETGQKIRAFIQQVI
jgi:glycosyltransferase involved in cell wall biosynthesis